MTLRTSAFIVLCHTTHTPRGKKKKKAMVLNYKLLKIQLTKSTVNSPHLRSKNYACRRQCQKRIAKKFQLTDKCITGHATKFPWCNWNRIKIGTINTIINKKNFKKKKKKKKKKNYKFTPPPLSPNTTSIKTLLNLILQRSKSQILTKRNLLVCIKDL